MVQVDKKERKLKKSEEKQIEKIYVFLKENPDAILWVELVLNTYMNSPEILKRIKSKEKGNSSLVSKDGKSISLFNFDQYFEK
ncbi:hypothetical protein [Leptospira noguchii]|uniref:Uncharacterized protein n=1 Tax=Leptospira noguchii TaxID=28182 RepID=A0AAE9GAB0_9LEPT|nr:hypothetical protein [Leptospira noguchii]UOG30239.1 hypothetical protein MAL06_16900 [Leptospira noguchii]UOG56361.1 hypothetical protein MAL03_16395 [Leptospira noguchii]